MFHVFPFKVAFVPIVATVAKAYIRDAYGGIALPVGPGTGVSGRGAPLAGTLGRPVAAPDGVGRGATVKVGFTTGVMVALGVAGALGRGVRGPGVGSGAGVGRVGNGAGGTRGSGNAGSVAAAII